MRSAVMEPSKRVGDDRGRRLVRSLRAVRIDLHCRRAVAMTEPCRDGRHRHAGVEQLRRLPMPEIMNADRLRHLGFRPAAHRGVSFARARRSGLRSIDLQGKNLCSGVEEHAEKKAIRRTVAQMNEVTRIVGCN